MKAIGLRSATGGAALLEDFTTAKPILRPRDILVRVVACATNPVDTKLRAGRGKPGPLEERRIFGFDGAGTIEAVGSESGKTSKPVVIADCGEL